MEKLSIVIPVYNSENTINEVISRTEVVLKKLAYKYEYEIILVNDASRDNTLQVCKNVVCNNELIKLINFTKNFGQHNALMAGIRYVTGEYAIFLDDDLQTPPEEIPKLIDAIVCGNYDVVFAKYEIKKHAWYRNVGSFINDVMAQYLINKPKNLKVSSYFIARRFIIDEILKYDKPYPYLLGLILRVTQNIGNVVVMHNERKVGKSNYNLTKLVKLWLNGFTNFSVRPLRVSSVLGFICAILGFVFIVALIIKKLLVPETQMGWTSIMTGIVFFGGVQLMSIGLLGEYIGRIYLSINNTPQYVIKDMYNVKVKNDEH